MFNLLNKDGGIMQKMEMNGNGLDWVNDFWMMVDDGIVDWMMGTTRTTKTKKNLKQLN